MVGEIRDTETAQIAINSALTGHLVFTTVHANNVLDVLGRFLNMGVEAYQFVSALNCVLAQRLVRIICDALQAAGRRSTRALLEESGLDPALEHTHTFYEGVGCIECGGTGYKGRTAICELLDLTDRIREMILEKRPTSEIKKAAREEGMRFLRESAVERVMHGHDDAARDQQGDVRRMSLLVLVRDAPPPDVAVEIAAGPRLGRGARVARRPAGRRGARRRAAAAGRARAVADRAEHRTTAPAVVGGARRACSSSVGGGRGASASSCPISVAKVSLVRFEQVPARAAGSRSAGPLAGAEDGAVSDRGRAGQLRAGRRAPATARSSSSRSRAATSSQEYEELCADGRRARRARRSRDVQRHQRGARRHAARRPATGCW